MINGLPVDDQLGNGAVSDWEALIDPLLPGAAAAPKKAGAAKKAKKAGKGSKRA
jgi:hypothetical protein